MGGKTAEVILNGRNPGIKWWGKKVFDLSNMLKPKDNYLEIKVTTLLWNYCNAQSMEKNPMAKLWANSNRRKEDKPLATGLIGPIRIY